MKLTRLIIFLIFFISASTFLYIYINSKEHNKNTKYIILFFIESLIFLLSIEYGFSLFLSYVLVVFISCLYLDEYFTLKIEALCYILMIFSLYIRANTQTPTFLNHLTPLRWGLAYCLGCTVEYLVYSFFTFFLVKIAKHTLINSYIKKKKIQEIQNQLLQGFANIVESKDKTTGDHVKRTSNYVHLICKKLIEHKVYTEELTPYTANLMVRAAPFHDLGKLAISSDILNKPGRLTEKEFAQIQKHPVYGANFILKHLQGIEDKELINYASQMALYHHEKINGNGYSFRLVDDEIPLCAKIMAAADILDALLSPRSYKEAYTINKALQILTELSGNALDSVIVGILYDSAKEINQIIQGNYRQDD